MFTVVRCLSIFFDIHISGKWPLSSSIFPKIVWSILVIDSHKMPVIPTRAFSVLYTLKSSKNWFIIIDKTIRFLWEVFNLFIILSPWPIDSLDFPILFIKFGYLMCFIIWAVSTNGELCWALVFFFVLFHVFIIIILFFFIVHFHFKLIVFILLLHG